MTENEKLIYKIEEMAKDITEIKVMLGLLSLNYRMDNRKQIGTFQGQPVYSEGISSGVVGSNMIGNQRVQR